MFIHIGLNSELVYGIQCLFLMFIGLNTTHTTRVGNYICNKMAEDLSSNTLTANAIVLYEPTKQPSEQKPWITITVAGATAGVVVAAITYATTSTTTNAMASTAGFTLDILGDAISAGVTYFMGYVPGYAVKFAAKSAAKTTEDTIKHTGMIASAVISSAAGAATALSITIGTRLVECSIEYGGKISRELAEQLSEAYLRYRASRSTFEESGDICELVDNDWLIVSTQSTPVSSTFATPIHMPNTDTDTHINTVIEPLILNE